MGHIIHIYPLSIKGFPKIIVHHLCKYVLARKKKKVLTPPLPPQMIDRGNKNLIVCIDLVHWNLNWNLKWKCTQSLAHQ